MTLLLGAVWLLIVELKRQSFHRIDDRAGVIDPAELSKFEAWLTLLHIESGVDIRFLLVDSVPGETLEAFAVRQARALGIGRDLDRRSVLFAYDMSARRLRIEVGPKLQDIFTDAFTGYLMREHMRSFFAAGTPTVGFRLTMLILHARIRQAVLGQAYDPSTATFIEDRRRLASGGGATGLMPGLAKNPGFLNQPASEKAKRAFGPQPSVQAAYHRYLEWLIEAPFQVDVGLFTEPSRTYMSRLPATPAMAEYMLFLEYGQSYRVLIRDTLAFLYFTSTPLASPHFFRRTEDGWQIDIIAEVRNTRNYVGGPWSWGMLERDDDFTRTFIDRYTRETPSGSILRVAGGNNRMLPTHAVFDVPEELTQSDADEAPGVERITLAEAGERIAAIRGKPAIVVLYATGDRWSQRWFPTLVQFIDRCQSQGFEVLAFSVDENWYKVRELPHFLRGQDAPFSAVHIYPWVSGQFGRSMAPLGFRTGQDWLPPLLAVRDVEGRVVVQTDGIWPSDHYPEYARVEAAIERVGLRGLGDRRHGPR